MDVKAVLASKVLLKALQKQVAELEKDLTPTGKADPRLNLEWRAAKSAERTAAFFETWLGERVTQVAVAWVLGTVFLRFCEDNGLIEQPYIAGPVQPDDRLQLAQDRQVEYFHQHPERTDRDWLLAGFEAMAVSPVAAALFDKRHNPMWTIQPSHDAIKALLAFWRQTGPDGEIVHDLTGPEWDTRFLGDLYQDLSEAARKTYALLQTPEFVEEFILKYTLGPAIEEFGLEPAPPPGHENLPHRLRVIDPACGSGHFLLGAFRKLLTAWETAEPNADKWELVAEALGSVHGVDKNPFAVAIARFRLMLAAMRAGGIERLTKDVDFLLNIAVGDSLLHGKGAPGRQVELDFGGETSAHTYRTEDVDDFIRSVNILEVGTYHVVVGNPPYITPKDKQERDNYRKAYASCHMQYALSVPFIERLFQLAILGIAAEDSPGYVGQITANSFMKREFGRKIIEEFFPKVDLTHIIDTSGAYIPGHGTPTVILLGRQRVGRSNSTIRAVLGVRGEPGQPDDPAMGLVWQAIVRQIDVVGSESAWVSVVDLARSDVCRFPLSLSGGGSLQLMELIAKSAAQPIVEIVADMGNMLNTREDDAYILGGALARRSVPSRVMRWLIEGSDIRDWRSVGRASAIFPYSSSGGLADFPEQAKRLLWPNRKLLLIRRSLSGTQESRGLPWYEYSAFSPDRYNEPVMLVFVLVATHAHFMLRHDDEIFSQAATVIRFTKESAHLAACVLGVLNSSTACFWLKQVSHNKGSTVDTHGARQTTIPWENFYEFTGSKLEQFPLPSSLPLEFGRQLDALAQRLASLEPSAVSASGTPTRARLDGARAKHGAVRGTMIAFQEELDWDVYWRYGLVSSEEASGLIAEPGDVPELKLGERAFEIVLARRVAAGEAETQWFARHRSTPITEIPKEWPEAYRHVVERRISKIERDRNIGLIERPECKRRWQSQEWEDKERAALRTWLLDRCEQRSLWFAGDGQPAAMTVNRLADRLRADTDVVSVARLLAGPDADLADVLREVVSEDHVPFLAAYRYKPSGMDKRRQWERTWDSQREEDTTGKKIDIPVPPKYASADFAKASYWRHRGKLDVPKERFISYPGASPDSDAGSLLLGWAGWDHREQASVLVSLIESRSSEDGWDTPRLMGLLAGLLEVMPWVRQWHGEVADGHDQSWADAYDGYLTAQREERRLTEAALRSWAPPQGSRGRRAKS